jgi:hypothetical protein
MSFLQSSSCFLAIPPGNEFGPVRQTVTDALGEFQVEALDVLNLEPGTAWASAIADMISQADFVIADVTGSSSNTVYELGIAYGLRKPALMLAQEQVSLPGDLALQQPLIYRSNDLPKLGEYLRYWIRDILNLQRPNEAPRFATR